MASDEGTEPYSCLSLFTGAGGLDVGIGLSRQFRSLGCVEVDPDFCDTLRRNRDAGRFGHPDLQVFETDITQFPPDQAKRELRLRKGELDLLVGGPPCQAFSTAGRRRSVEDARGELLWSFLDYIVALRPKFFLMENVRGLLSAALRHRPIAERPANGGPPLAPDELPGSVIATWLADLVDRTDGAYRVDCFEVNAVNYGAPQLRERVLFIGNRLGSQVEFPAPTHVAPEQLALYPGRQAFRTLRQALEGIDDDDPVVLDFSPRKKKYLTMVPAGGNWRTLPRDVQVESMGQAWHAKGGRSGWWRRLSWDLPCPTLVTMPNHASTAMCHPSEVRALSVGEYAAIQEFPAGWEFAGTVQKQYEQAGNAVPARLGRLAGEVIAASLDEAARRRSSRRGSFPPYRRVYVQSHVRTRKWFKGGESFVWTDGADDNERYYGTKQVAQG